MFDLTNGQNIELKSDMYTYSVLHMLNNSSPISYNQNIG